MYNISCDLFLWSQLNNLLVGLEMTNSCTVSPDLSEDDARLLGCGTPLGGNP